jgi:hypothetical protein
MGRRIDDNTNKKHIAANTRRHMVLGLVGMLIDISSEMIYSLLPLFMVTVLRASAFAVGLVDRTGKGICGCLKLSVRFFPFREQTPYSERAYILDMSETREDL